MFEDQRQGGERKLVRQIVKKYHQLYNGAWNNLDLSKSSKRALATSGFILLLGAISTYAIITKKD
jgi:hypothetical protein